MTLWAKLPQLTPLILALRNMRARLWRTLLTCAGIVLGVAVILAIAVTNDSTLKSIRDVFDEASGRASLYVESSAADGAGFEQSALAKVESVEGVVAAAPAMSATTLLARDAKNWQIAFGINGQAAGNRLQVLGVDPAIDRDVRDYSLTAGRWLRADAYEAILTQDFTTRHFLGEG